MKMSRKNFETFTNFYNEAVEHATNEEMNIIFSALTMAFALIKQLDSERSPKECKNNSHKA